MCGVRKASNFVLLQAAIQVFRHHLLKIFLFCIELPWHPCGKSIDHKCEGLFLDSQFYSVDLYMSILMFVPLCLEYINLVVSFEIRSVSPPCLFFSFKIAFNILGPLHFHMNFRISLSTSAKQPAEILVGAVLNL